MRIKWLNAELTRAEITKGYLWWKRTATVRQSVSYAHDWYYIYGDDEYACPFGLALFTHKIKTAATIRDKLIWGKSKLPAARLLK